MKFDICMCVYMYFNSFDYVKLYLSLLFVYMKLEGDHTYTDGSHFFHFFLLLCKYLYVPILKWTSKVCLCVNEYLND